MAMDSLGGGDLSARDEELGIGSTSAQAHMEVCVYCSQSDKLKTNFPSFQRAFLLFTGVLIIRVAESVDGNTRPFDNRGPSTPHLVVVAQGKS